MTSGRITFGADLLIVLAGAALLLLDVIESPVAIMTGIIGIGLIASSTGIGGRKSD